MRPLPFVPLAAMSGAPPASEDETGQSPTASSINRRYLEGLSCGREARQQLPPQVAFNDAQRSWLRGFLCGLFGDSPSGVEATKPPAPLKPARADADQQSASSAAANRSDPEPLPLSRAVTPPPHAQFTPDNPSAARIVTIKPLGEEPFGAWELAFDVQGAGLVCRPGDMLGIYPNNDPDLVRRLLRLLRARGQESVTTARGSGPAWRALLEELDIHTPTPELVRLLAHCARHPDEAARLELYSRSAAPQEASVLGLLRRFPSARPQLSDLVRALRPLAPHCFPLFQGSSEPSDKLLALITSDAPEASARGWLESLARGQLRAGDWLSVYVERRPEAHPPAEGDVPVVLIAYGKGEACAHAFLEERARLRHRGRNWLFVTTGSEHPQPHYAEQFAAWQAARVLTRIDVAANAEMLARLSAQQEMLGRWLVDRSFVYVFGNDSECAEVYHALVHLLAGRARVTPQEAAAQLDALLTSGQLRFVAL